MTTVETSPDPVPDDKVSLLSRQQGIAALALLSFGAGFLHAAVVKAHEGAGDVSTIFTALAIFQVAWAAVVLAKPHRLVLIVGAVVNTVTILGWAITRVSDSGISFIEGFDHKEAVGFTDLVSVGIEAVLVVGIVATLAAGTKRSFWPSGQLGMASLAAVGLIVALVGVPGVAKGAEHGEAGHAHGEEAAAGGHSHGAADEHAGMTDSEMAAHGDSGSHAQAKPYDPALPIDLSGTPGVTPEQQAQAENLIAVTLADLPQWADPAYAESKGFRSIGDGGTGVEHFVNTEYQTDDHLLDPDYPESLVYNTEGGGRRLVAAMFMADRGTPIDEVPDLGQGLVQWHTHNNLCYNPEGKVRGITNEKGECPKGLVKPVETPMVHVWLEKHPCGPFAALEGIGGGVVAEGETKLCDHAHGAGM